MAADLIMPTLPDQQVQSQYFVAAHHPPPTRPPVFHARSQSYHQPTTTNSSFSQQVSPLSSAHGSPTSPGGRVHGARQNRPLFMPAVLRPTEFPSKTARSPRGEDGPDPEELHMRRSSASFISLPGLNMFGSRLARRATGDSGKGFTITDLDMDPDLFPQVSGEPTRKHWKPDPRSAVCDDPTCTRTFGYFIRRHHCRKCGNIFCDSHSAHAIPLDQDCNYNPRGSPSRSCTHCFAEFVAWKSRNNSQASSEQGSVIDASSGTTTNGSAIPTSPITAASSPIKATANPGPARGPEAAASVPRDWNWSTF